MFSYCFVIGWLWVWHSGTPGVFRRVIGRTSHPILHPPEGCQSRKPPPQQHRVCYGVSATILWQVATTFFTTSCPMCLHTALWLAARTSYHLPFYLEVCQKRKLPLSMYTESTIWDRAVWVTQFDAQCINVFIHSDVLCHNDT